MVTLCDENGPEGRRRSTPPRVGHGRFDRPGGRRWLVRRRLGRSRCAPGAQAVVPRRSVADAVRRHRPGGDGALCNRARRSSSACPASPARSRTTTRHGASPVGLGRRDANCDRARRSCSSFTRRRGSRGHEDSPLGAPRPLHQHPWPTGMRELLATMTLRPRSEPTCTPVCAPRRPQRCRPAPARRRTGPRLPLPPPRWWPPLLAVSTPATPPFGVVGGPDRGGAPVADVVGHLATRTPGGVTPWRESQVEVLAAIAPAVAALASFTAAVTVLTNLGPASRTCWLSSTTAPIAHGPARFSSRCTRWTSWWRWQRRWADARRRCHRACTRGCPNRPRTPNRPRYGTAKLKVGGPATGWRRPSRCRTG
jgi:hypothetical protein